MLDQCDKAVVETLELDGLSGALDHRVMAGGKRQRHGIQHARAQAGGVVALCQPVAVLQGGDKPQAHLAVRQVRRTNHADFHVQVGLGCKP